MESNDVGRLAGGIFLAICSGLSTEAAKAACDVLYSWSNNEGIRLEDRRIFKCVADAATRDAADLDAEWARLTAKPDLRVVSKTTS